MVTSDVALKAKIHWFQIQTTGFGSSKIENVIAVRDEITKALARSR